jgi:hypothetical protein
MVQYKTPITKENVLCLFLSLWLGHIPSMPSTYYQLHFYPLITLWQPPHWPVLMQLIQHIPHIMVLLKDDGGNDVVHYAIHHRHDELVILLFTSGQKELQACMARALHNVLLTQLPWFRNVLLRLWSQHRNTTFFQTHCRQDIYSLIYSLVRDVHWSTTNYPFFYPHSHRLAWSIFLAAPYFELVLPNELWCYEIFPHFQYTTM